jgi:hypothetical protein
MQAPGTVWLCLGLAVCLAVAGSKCFAADAMTEWLIQSPGGYYTLNNDDSQQNPTVNITAGQTLLLVTQTARNHPVCVQTDNVRGGTKYALTSPAICSNSVNFTIPIPAENYPQTL